MADYIEYTDDSFHDIEIDTVVCEIKNNPAVSAATNEESSISPNHCCCIYQIKDPDNFFVKNPCFADFLITVTTLLCIALVFVAIGSIAYGINYGANYKKYNMTTGCRLNQTVCLPETQLLCYDEFPGGCVFVGWISVIASLFISSFVIMLFAVFGYTDTSTTNTDES